MDRLNVPPAHGSSEACCPWNSMRFCTPTNDELNFARIPARKGQPWFGLLLLLKSFQGLGYFPSVEEIPPAIVQRVRAPSGANSRSAAALSKYWALACAQCHRLL